MATVGQPSNAAMAKAPSAGPSESSSGAITKRLTSELMTLMMSSSPGISAFPADDGDLTRWIGKITGPEGTVYDGLTFRISLHFPPTYPFVAPVVRFETPCFHPNFDMNGNICLDMLKEKWSAVLSVETVLLSLQSLLNEPNNASPLNPEAADLWDNRAAFKAALMRSYQPVDQ